MKNIEEERRLFYVGVTRPRKQLYFVSNCKELPLSRFIEEVREDITIENNTNVKESMFFNYNDENTTKQKYSVIDLIDIMKDVDIKKITDEKIVPTDVVICKIYDVELKFNAAIKKHNLESEFGEFCDRLLTRNIIIQQGNEIDDSDTKFIINGIDLSKEEMEISNKYKLEKLLLKYNYDNIGIYHIFFVDE